MTIPNSKLNRNMRDLGGRHSNSSNFLTLAEINLKHLTWCSSSEKTEEGTIIFSNSTFK